MPHPSDTRKAAVVLSAIALIEGAGAWIIAGTSARGFLLDTGFVDGSAEPAGWVLAIGVFVAFTAFACRLPSVRANLLAITWLKLLGLAVAVATGFCEEPIFRKFLMEALATHGWGVVVQVTVSALAFGLVHGIWGAFRRNFKAAAAAVIATGMLGLGLALVYIVSHRLLAPCIVSHFLINAFTQPGLVLATVRGEMRQPAQG